MGDTDLRRARRFGWSGWAWALAPAAWVAGTAAQVAQPALWAAGTYAALAATGGALVGVAWRVRRALAVRSVARPACRAAMLPALFSAIALALGVALLAFAAVGLRAGVKAADRIAPELEGRDLLVTGVIDRMPDRGEDGWRFPLAVRDARLLDASGQAGDAVHLPARVLVSWYAHGYRYPGARLGVDAGAGAEDPATGGGGLTPASPPRAGERWRLALRLKAPHGNRNPHGFDAELWLWEQGIGATGYVRTGSRSAAAMPQRLPERGVCAIECARQWTRDRILASAAATTAGEATRRHEAGIVAALVTGDQSAIARQDWTLFRVAGVAHLMVISGLHITMTGWLAALALGGLWRLWARHAAPRRRNPALWLPAPVAGRIGGVACALLYALFSGWGVPAQRTVLMLAAVTLLRLLGVAWPWWLTWLWAMAAVLATDPWALTQPGFWLSFVAVGILFATDLGERSGRDEREAGRASAPSATPVASASANAPTATDAERRAGPRGVWHGLRRGLHSGLYRARRHLWPPLKALLRDQGIVTIAITPLTLLLFHQASVVGLLANLVAVPWVTLVVTPLALLGVALPPLWQLAAWSLQPLMAWLTWLASWPMASLAWPAVPWPAGAAAVMGGVLLALRWPWGLRLAGVPLLAGLALWTPGRPPPGQFELLAADIGQGSAIVLRTARHALLFDAGPRYSAASDAGNRELAPLLAALDERLDGILLSHRDTDHTGGAASVLQAQPGAWLMESETDPPPGAPGHTPLLCQAGQTWDWDGVRFEVLHPPAARYAEAAKPNARSCVLRVIAQAGQGASALMTGDIEARQERALAIDAREAGVDLHADVLMAPHHGSHSSSSPALIAAVHPRFALAQAGYRNRYGHPHPEIVARYRAAGVAFVATPACGAIRWQSAQPDRVHCEREEVAHYWQHEAGEP